MQTESLWKLEEFPLTEMMGNFDAEFKNFDLELTIDSETGFVHLQNVVPSDILYNSSDYAYRSLNSPKTSRTIQKYLDFFSKTTSGKTFNSIIDIGGNDLTTAKLLKGYASQISVVDPVCSENDGEIIDGINVIGRKIEQINLKELHPDVIVCRHTIEHIENPQNFISQLFDQCKSDCTYVFELPDFDCLLESQRLDAIFHQHLNYFTLDTVTNLIIECGGKVIDHQYDFQGSCGGALYVAFQLDNGTSQKIDINVEKQKDKIIQKIKIYESMMSAVSDELSVIPGPIFGYGAGLMLSSYAYHLKTDLSFLETVLDDDPEKEGTGYRNLPVSISHPANILIPKNSSFLITSLENIRPIYKRVMEFDPRLVISPFLS